MPFFPTAPRPFRRGAVGVCSAVHTTRNSGGRFVEKVHRFCDKLHCFHAKVHGFSRLLLVYGSTTADDWGKVHRAGENVPQTRRCIPRFLQPRWVFFCSSPLVPLRKRGGVFALRPLQATKWLSARSKWEREGESIDEAVRKHGRKGVDTRAQKSTGRRELNVCRREDEALWAKRRLSREPLPSRRGG